MSHTKSLIVAATELQTLEQAARYAVTQVEAARTRLHADNLTTAEWSEMAGDYARANADLNRITSRAKIVRGRVHFHAERA